MQVVPEGTVEPAEPVDDVHLKQLAAGTEASVQHFHIDPGAVVPEHSHPHEQVGYLVDGTLDFTVDGETITIEPGDSYVIPGDEPHAATNPGDDPAIGIEVFAPPRTGSDWQA